MSLYNSIEKSLSEAIEMEQNQIPLTKRQGMPAPTFYASNREKELIDEYARIRKTQLAEMIGNK